MELLILENDKLVKYNVKYNEDEMNIFLRNVINKYGTTTNLLIKLSNEDQILDYCDEYSDLRVIKKCVDNSKIHKGRKRVTRKPQKEKYLYSLTAIYYPEIYFTITKLLEQENLDLSVLSKYFGTEKKHSFKYYIEEGYTQYKYREIKSLQYLLDSNEKIEGYKNTVTERRMLQKECLKTFYDMLSLTPLNSKEASNYEMPSAIKTIHGYMGAIGGMEYLLDSDLFIQNHIMSLYPLKEFKSARANGEIIGKINNLSIDKVKTK